MKEKVLHSGYCECEKCDKQWELRQRNIMLNNLRMDYISSFKDGTVVKMSDLRQKFIDLEGEILKYKPDLYSENMQDSARVLDECLSHLEVSQMYAIKLLCLLNELK